MEGVEKEEDEERRRMLRRTKGYGGKVIVLGGNGNVGER